MISKNGRQVNAKETAFSDESCHSCADAKNHYASLVIDMNHQPILRVQHANAQLGTLNGEISLTAIFTL